MLRRIWLADHRGRDAIVVLVPRARTTPVTPTYVDGAGTPVRFSRRIKATDRTGHIELREGYRDPEALARALINGDPEVDLDAVGRETGPCDRVFVGSDGKPLYSAEIVEVRFDRDSIEVERRPPVDVPSNLVPDTPPIWSRQLIPTPEAVRRFVFSRAYQVRHTTALEFDFLHGLAAYLDQHDSLAVVGSGPRGMGPLIPERNAVPMKGFLSGQVRGDTYRLIFHLAAFELRAPEERGVQP